MHQGSKNRGSGFYLPYIRKKITSKGKKSDHSLTDQVHQYHKHCINAVTLVAYPQPIGIFSPDYFPGIPREKTRMERDE
jgi:hypothetical protein